MNMANTNFDKVREYYSSFDEWARLDTLEGQLEFQIALEIIDKHLPQSAKLLDLGGGSGRYTVALAQKNHTVSLADLSPDLLEIARKKIKEHNVGKQVESVKEVNATALSEYSDNTFDAVLAFGPYYHLLSKSNQELCSNEIHRVLKNDGFIFAAFIPRLSGLAALVDRAALNPDQITASTFSDTYESGTFRNQDPKGFQEGYYATTDEIKKLFEATGFRELEVISLRGIAYGKEKMLMQIKESNPDLYDTILEMVKKTSSIASVVDMSGHALYIGQKK